MNNQIGISFPMTVVYTVWSILFNIFLDIIIQVTLENHLTTISIRGRYISNLRFADEIALLAGSESELQALTESLDKSAASYGMEISHGNIKILINVMDHHISPYMESRSRMLKHSNIMTRCKLKTERERKRF